MSVSRIHQIAYSLDQLNDLIYPSVFNFPNEEFRYLFFESQVWRAALNQGMHREGSPKYFSILAPGFVDKLVRFRKGSGRKFAIASPDFTPQGFADRLNESATPVVSLIRTSPHNICELAEIFHPGFSHAFRNLLVKMGVQVDSYWCWDAVYCNYWAGTPEFLDGFAPFLNTALDIMENDEEMRYLSMKNSRYRKPFPAKLQELHGIDYWPLMPFLAERLISMYIKINNTPVTYYI